MTQIVISHYSSSALHFGDKFIVNISVSGSALGSSDNGVKNFDVPDIDDAISEAKDEEQREQEAAHAEKIAYALEYFTKKAPDILKNMQGTVSQLDARKFAVVLRKELKNASDEMAHRFISKIEPIVKRAESADRR